MNLDRGLQRGVLEDLRARYPESVDIGTLTDACGADLQANLFYLEECGLIHGSHEMGPGSPFVLARITATGLDFLQDDGGLGAIRSAPSRGDDRRSDEQA